MCSHCHGTTIISIGDIERILGRRMDAYRPIHGPHRDPRDRAGHHGGQPSTPWHATIPDRIRCDDTHHRGDRPICRACEQELERQIGDIPALAHDLALAVRRDVQFNPRGTSRADTERVDDGWTQHLTNHPPMLCGPHCGWIETVETPVDYQPAAAHALNQLARILPTTHPDPAKSATAAARWILAHWPDLMRRRDLADFTHQLSRTIVRAHRIIDRPADLNPYGPCPTPTCTWRLWAPKDAPTITCPNCGYHATITDHTQQILNVGEAAMLTLDQLVGAITTTTKQRDDLGQPVHQIVTRERLQHWIDHDGLPRETRTIPQWNDGDLTAPETVNVYRLGDVLDRARELSEQADTITTGQVATLLGVGEAAVRKLVERGQLTPIRPGARPLRFNPNTIPNGRITA